MPRNDLTKLNDSCQDTHHPLVHGDILNGRYRVVHKLHQSIAAKIWLCCDIEDRKHRWKVVKVNSTARSQKVGGDAILFRSGQEILGTGRWEDAPIAWPLDQFWVEGQQGRHLCTVTALHGPSIATLRGGDPEQIRSAFRKAAEGIRYLHDLGICHGDIQPNNILFRLKAEVNNITESQMVKLWGRSGAGNGNRREADSKYTTGSVKRGRSLEATSEIVLVGLSNAFHAADAPAISRISARIAAPELLNGQRPSYGTDSWALACAILEIRTGCSVFGVKEGDTDKAIERLEVLSSPSQSLQGSSDDVTTYKCFENEQLDVAKAMGSELGQKVAPKRSAKLPTLYGDIGCSKALYSCLSQDLAAHDSHPGLSNRLSKAEVLILGDLLSRIFKYHLRERLSIHEILEHSWFASSFRRGSMPSQVQARTYYDSELHESIRGQHAPPKSSAEHFSLRKRDKSSYQDGTGNREDYLTRTSSYIRNRIPSRIRNWLGFGQLGLLKGGVGAFFAGLAVATYFWTILITILLKPMTVYVPFTSDRAGFGQVARSLASAIFEGTSLSEAWGSDERKYGRWLD